MRRSSMLPVLTVVLLWAVRSQAEVPVQEDFDLEKFAGTWHIMSGVSNCPVFQGMKDLMKTSVTIVKPIPNGDMEITTGYPFPEECKKVVLYFKKTDQLGHFTQKDEMAKRDVRVIETDYSNFALFYTYKVPNEDAPSNTIQLYTREPTVSPEVMEKFKKHYHEIGLTDDMMVMLPKSDLCLKALSG
ncbi:lipocalin-like 1 protein [Hemicordylus capensis]|uniref:lipocalin-like 1 protein n=1 Tax=Hemicordylus capensis TaxID=884348 RepID=UPI002304AF2C|nr:lipocalin-like 1 protein [Hemicordylus capensis]